MATWFEITFTGDPTDEDRERAAELVRGGFTSGQLPGTLAEEPGEHAEVYRYTLPPYEVTPRYYYGSAKRSCLCGDDECAQLGPETLEQEQDRIEQAVADAEASPFLIRSPEPVFGSYTEDQLREAFNLVKNPENWKERIDKVVPADADLHLIDCAVTFYTGGSIEYQPVTGGHRVTSGGYYANIGS
jgi:hypothetical protein